MPAVAAFSPQGTIVALASAPGRAGVAVVRISGPEAGAVFEKLCVPATLPAPRRAALREIRDFRTSELLDRALVLWFPAPASFTGEPVVELHLHGGRAILTSVLDALCALDGVRLAEPGAFSRRAFENGKLDLTEAEGLADLVDAETAAQRRQALRQMEGALGRLYRGWAERLKKRLAFIEAELDFADEDLPPEINAQRLDDLQRLAREIAAHLADNHRGEKLREGFMVALLGAPNAGKSSLLNALAQRDAAIVAPTPGTTRDAIEVHLDLGGYPVTLVDTAGLRESADAIENEGVRRALSRAAQADLKLLVFDGQAWPGGDPGTMALADADSLLIVNKKDAMAAPGANEGKTLFLSAKTGEGLAALTQKIGEEIERRFAGDASPSLTRARHREALIESRAFLLEAIAAEEPELCAESLRQALKALGRITGHVDVEDLLDLIFSSFCIGK